LSGTIPHIKHGLVLATQNTWLDCVGNIKA
jgi:hypothetical protein